MSSSDTKWTRVCNLLLSPKFAIAVGIFERIIFFFWGLYQDAVMEPRFTDIDYFVFTDAARFVQDSASNSIYGNTPYARETYRYTPLLAWMLLPTTWFFSFGKVLFACGDIVAGILMLGILRATRVPPRTAVLYAGAVWLWNPMVSIISTRGSSEGLLGAIVMALLYAVERKRVVVGGIVAGFAVHFKIYPVIYIPTVIWSLASTEPGAVGGPGLKSRASIFPSRLASKSRLLNFVNTDRLLFALTSLFSFIFFTGWMYIIYGTPFLQHTYFHHLSRIDHRHNFSPYSTLLYMASSPSASSLSFGNKIIDVLLQPQLWAFFPQLFLSGLLIPLLFAKRDVPKTMFLQTFAFVTFNKVCTAQYFMWYMVLLPFYLPSLTAYLMGKKEGSEESTKPTSQEKKVSISTQQDTKRKVYGVLTGLTMAGLWIAAQALWVRQGYLLEFLGVSTFYPGLFVATLVFFGVNCGLLGMFIRAM